MSALARTAASLAAAVIAVAVLSGCADTVAGTAQPLDPDAPYQQREAIATAVILDIVPRPQVSAVDVGLKACRALDVGVSPARLAREVSAEGQLTMAEVRTVVAASTYGWCSHHWSGSGMASMAGR